MGNGSRVGIWALSSPRACDSYARTRNGNDQRDRIGKVYRRYLSESRHHAFFHGGMVPPAFYHSLCGRRSCPVFAVNTGEPCAVARGKATAPNCVLLRRRVVDSEKKNDDLSTRWPKRSTMSTWIIALWQIFLTRLERLGDKWVRLSYICRSDNFDFMAFMVRAPI